MSIDEVLSTLITSRINYVLIHDILSIDEIYEHGYIENIEEAIKTKCSITVDHLMALADNDYDWDVMSLDDLPSLVSYRVEIGCIHTGHVLVCTRMGDDDVMISSYIARYGPKIEVVDRNLLDQHLKDIYENGVGPLWNDLFHCNESTCRCQLDMCISGSRNKLSFSGMKEKIENLQSEIEKASSDPTHTIHSDEYSWLMDI